MFSFDGLPDDNSATTPQPMAPDAPADSPAMPPVEPGAAPMDSPSVAPSDALSNTPPPSAN